MSAAGRPKHLQSPCQALAHADTLATMFLIRSFAGLRAECSDFRPQSVVSAKKSVQRGPAEFV
jgi:hypothetical protein